MTSEPFFLDRSYANFIPGVTRLKFSSLDMPNVWSIYAGVVGVIFFGGSGVLFLVIAGLAMFEPTIRANAAQSPETPGMLLLLIVTSIVSLLFGGYFLRLIYRAIRALFLYMRLRSGGVLLDGIVVNTRNFVRRTRFASYRYVEVTYAFTTPEGRPLTRKISAYRPDLPSGLPPKGRAVRVLYASDDVAVML